MSSWNYCCRREVNPLLHLTSAPLRGAAAGEQGRYTEEQG